MEYLRNGSAQRLMEKTFVSVREACTIIAESLFGLEHAHNQAVPIIHRDVKPSNILLANEGHAKLSDFGLAIEYYGPALPEGYKTHLAPEVISGQTQDTVSDIYSVGVTLFRLLNNQQELTFPFSSPQEHFKAVSRELFPERRYLPHVPQRVIKVTNKAMRATRNRRFPHCQEMRQALERLQFFIDWRAGAKDRWIGQDRDDEYQVYVTKKRSGYEVCFQKNRRRQTKNCSEFSNEAEAYGRMYSLIESTTIS